jgi:hypothetical protein
MVEKHAKYWASWDRNHAKVSIDLKYFENSLREGRYNGRNSGKCMRAHHRAKPSRCLPSWSIATQAHATTSEAKKSIGSHAKFWHRTGYTVALARIRLYSTLIDKNKYKSIYVAFAKIVKSWAKSCTRLTSKSLSKRIQATAATLTVGIAQSKGVVELEFQQSRLQTSVWSGFYI